MLGATCNVLCVCALVLRVDTLCEKHSVLNYIVLTFCIIRLLIGLRSLTGFPSTLLSFDISAYAKYTMCGKSSDEKSTKHQKSTIPGGCKTLGVKN